MTFLHGSNSSFLIGAFDLTAYTQEVDPNDQVDEVDVSVWGTSYHQFIPGQISGTFKVQCLFDNTAGGAHTVLTSYLGLNQPATLCNGGAATFADGCALLYGYVKTRSEPSKVKDVVRTNVDITGTPGIDHGILLHPLVAETATNTGFTSYDFGSTDTSSKGWMMNLHCTVESGSASPTLTVTLQDSSDNVTFADVPTGSFSAVTTTAGLSITGLESIRRYVRIRWTIAGTTPSFTFAVAFAKRRI